MLRRAAVLGTTAHVASQRGEAKAGAAADQQATPSLAPAPVPQAAPAPAAPVATAPAAPAASSEDGYAEPMRFKGLFDAGVLTQAEFDAEKQKVLNG
jgi:hypothetical protein